MWVLGLAVLNSIIGSATNSWFKDTKLGIWFYAKLDQLYTYISKKLHLKNLSNEENWKQQYPNIAADFNDIKTRLKLLEDKLKN